MTQAHLIERLRDFFSFPKGSHKLSITHCSLVKKKVSENSFCG